MRGNAAHLQPLEELRPRNKPFHEVYGGSQDDPLPALDRDGRQEVLLPTREQSHVEYDIARVSPQVQRSQKVVEVDAVYLHEYDTCQ